MLSAFYGYLPKHLLNNCQRLLEYIHLGKSLQCSWSGGKFYLETFSKSHHLLNNCLLDFSPTAPSPTTTHFIAWCILPEPSNTSIDQQLSMNYFLKCLVLTFESIYKIWYYQELLMTPPILDNGKGKAQRQTFNTWMCLFTMCSK